MELQGPSARVGMAQKNWTCTANTLSDCEILGHYLGTLEVPEGPAPRGFQGAKYALTEEESLNHTMDSYISQGILLAWGYWAPWECNSTVTLLALVC